MQASQATKEDKKNDIKDASEKVVDFIYKLLLTSILTTIYNNIAIRTYVNSIALCQMLINITRNSHYL